MSQQSGNYLLKHALKLQEDPSRKLEPEFQYLRETASIVSKKC